MSFESGTTSSFISTFVALKQTQFSGRLMVKGPLDSEWFFYLFLGRVIYASGNNHSVRRWRRNVTSHHPQIDFDKLYTLPANTSHSYAEALTISWEYQLLYSGVEQRLFNREQAAKIISSIVVEVLFDVSQAMHVTYEIKPETSSVPQLVLLDPGQVIAEVQQVWQTWQKAKIADRFPNRAPVIKQPEQLQQRTSASVFQVLTQLLDGQSTLRDLSVKTKRDTVEVTCSLLPYIQAGLVELVDVPDLPAPVSPSAVATSQGPLIACVDDSPLVCQSMEKILKTGGYQFIAIQDSLRAIATLLTRKPDLIFLDLVMPNTNGYEICTQLRKVSVFRETPIIILTGNDGIIDRVRAKIVGSSGFLSKPVNAETVLEVTRAHLNNSSVMPQVEVGR